jgi:hypothetical protein
MDRDRVGFEVVVKLETWYVARVARDVILAVVAVVQLGGRVDVEGGPHGGLTRTTSAPASTTTVTHFFRNQILITSDS